jgi:GT2 family glycosyltransferase
MSTFRQLQGFDERFELFYDDVDMARRLEKLGGSAILHQNWGVHHAGASSSAVPTMSYVVGKVSRIRYLRKHYGRLASITSAITIAVLEWVTRSAVRRPEGQAARNEALRMQFRELLHPGVRVLR